MTIDDDAGYLTVELAQGGQARTVTLDLFEANDALAAARRAVPADAPAADFWREVRPAVAALLGVERVSAATADRVIAAVDDGVRAVLGKGRPGDTPGKPSSPPSTGSPSSA